MHHIASLIWKVQSKSTITEGSVWDSRENGALPAIDMEFYLM